MLVALIALAIFCLFSYKRQELKTLWRQILLDIPTFKPLPIIGHYNRFHGLNTEGKFT